jgi:4'-phosphopantetheinyl transferase
MTDRAVTVRLLAASADPRDDRARLAETGAALLGIAPTEIRVEQHCEDCGGDHGRPIASAVDGALLWVGLSRATGLVAVVASRTGPIGVDIESVAAVAGSPLDAFAPEELEQLDAAGDRDRLATRLWTAKEAILKADGRGLRCDPREIVLAGPLRLRSWPGKATSEVHLGGFEVGTDIVGTVATIGGAPMELRILDQRSSGSGLA